MTASTARHGASVMSMEHVTPSTGSARWFTGLLTWQDNFVSAACDTHVLFVGQAPGGAGGENTGPTSTGGNCPILAPGGLKMLAQP
jgi:hypothetical protein